MALLGGAGNPVGGSFTGSASAFETIGDHVYALNSADVTGDETTILEATTGNYYTVGKLRFAMNTSSGDDIQCLIYFNGQVVFGEYATSGVSEGDIGWPIDIIIPSYTIVKLTAENKAAPTARQVFISYVGRTYR